MSIQANVNQILSLAALVATQSPQFKAAAEKRTELGKIKQEEKILSQREALGKGKDPRLTQGIKEERFNLAEKKYKTNPTMANYEAKVAAAMTAAEGEAAVASLNKMEIQKAKGEFEDPNPEPEPTAKEIAEAEARDEAMAESLANPEPEVEGIDFENWETEIPRAKADQSLAAAQANKRITRERSFTSQRYGSWGRTDNKAFKGGSR